MSSDYIPPDGDLVTLSFIGEYIPPDGDLVALNFGDSSEEIPSKTQYLFPAAIGAPDFESQAIRLQYKLLYPTGFDTLVFSVPYIYNLAQIVKPSGWQSSNVGKPSQVVSYFKDVYPIGFSSALYGKPTIYNSTQYKSISGFSSQAFGTPYLMGGVKYLTGKGFNASAFGSVSVVNPTADQTIKPSGFNASSVPSPNVSPRIIYPKGIGSQSFGTPDIRDPSVKPIGETHTAYGVPTVWFHTRYLSPTGFNAFESGYPRVFDPTQFIGQLPTEQTAIFGDVDIRNKSMFIRPVGIFEEVVTQWLTVENNRRYYNPNGIDSQAFGVTAVQNKTPSIFVKPIEAPPIGISEISYAIRSILPAGFDLLGFGKPVVTKTPELFPKAFDSMLVGSPTVWFKNREVSLQNEGIDGFKSGDATVWFRYRYVAPIGWFSEVLSNPAVTDNVREILGSGFANSRYGTPWISHGTRYIEPVGIYTDARSSHMVGGTRYIEPAGFDATLFGERVIPEIQSANPLGFTGAIGVPTIYLQTQHISPYGFISAGVQPADRWGNTKAFNLTQYVFVEYYSESGLNPPSWPDWTLIENRNKQLNLTGFFSQKFGYASIENAARSLLVTGIEPPTTDRFDVSMISHTIRFIQLEGIEPPAMSDWAVAYNDAKVLAPTGGDQSSYGLPAVQNTRRSYSNVGQIDSQEFGLPMIAYRIRTIDIESRYSIAPPYISLPTVELSTRYIEPLGFENLRVPLPDLIVRFNIIAPSWAHRDYVGEPRVHNVTPEVGAYGHNSEEFGKPSIRTEWRNVYAQGDRTELFGTPIIADSKRTVTTAGWRDGYVSSKLVVTKTGTNPYVTQTIWLDPIGGGISGGIEPPKISSPSFNHNVVYARGFDSQDFGETKLHSNNIHVSIGMAIENIPVGPVVTNWRRYIEVEGIDNTIKVSDELRLSPNYIYPESFNYQGYIGLNKYGQPTATLMNRSIATNGSNFMRVGQPSVTLKTRYIKVPSVRGEAVGIPSIPFTPKTVSPDGADSSAFGKPTVAPPPYTGPQTVKPYGFNALSIDKPVIDLLHRTILASGHNSLRMGASVSKDTPYMWQGLRIGERVPLIVGGDDMSSFGTAFISLRIRNIELTGFDAFECDYTLTDFRKRMKVTGSITDYTEQLEPTAVSGFDSMSMGNPSVKWGQQFIRPDGNSDQFRKGAF